MIPIGPWADFSGSSLYYEGGDHRSRQGGERSFMPLSRMPVRRSISMKISRFFGTQVTGSRYSTSTPATTLEFSCHGIMFQGCSNLNYIEISATDIYQTIKYKPAILDRM